ncbi:helix-turn-helix protein [Leeuwenhoekiella aestuarii]|uniref:Helix-turn-helix protein n=1 Tax=Leeuwenhoekiella aestuarii TaxID=2249426 RepID=A0A4Q0NSM0_9FLAO|nr:helix-turn-helix domain-containing protein [Leeuwenhoekiella aestuarii]RXG13982.1 helix-turn-helix protein [Leeuwenhoekiella aestuarii]RXG18731.1 helix-turn-helix protein [Leeuwenhoekiella aestuarii]
MSGTVNLLTTDQLLEVLNHRDEKLIDHIKQALSIPNEPEELLTRDEACKFLKINSSTLWTWTNKGIVTAYGISNRRYYKRSELLQTLIKLNK